MERFPVCHLFLFGVCIWIWFVHVSVTCFYLECVSGFGLSMCLSPISIWSVYLDIVSQCVCHLFLFGVCIWIWFVHMSVACFYLECISGFGESMCLSPVSIWSVYVDFYFTCVCHLFLFGVCIWIWCVHVSVACFYLECVSGFGLSMCMSPVSVWSGYLDLVCPCVCRLFLFGVCI